MKGAGLDAPLTLADHIAHVARFWALAAVAALLLISIQNALVSDTGLRPFQEWLYVARLASYAAVLWCVPWTLLYALERLLGRFAPITGLFVAGAIFPLAREVALQLAAGEGVSALHVAPRTFGWLATAVLCLGALAAWAFQRSTLRLRLYVPLGLVGLAALIAFDRLYLRNYGMLASWVLLSALGVGAATLHRAVSALPRARNAVSAIATFAVFALLVVGAFRPGWVVSGRSTVLSEETSILALDVLAFGAEIAAVQFDLELAAKQPCPAPRPPVAWPALAISSDRRRNVIMISVDALRRDVIGKRLKGRSITPNLDRFAGESWVYRDAHTTYPATLFALAGAVTGLLPSEILFAPTPPDTMFQMLKQRVPDAFTVLPASEWFIQPAISKYVTAGSQRVTRRDAAAQTEDMLKRIKRLRAAGQPHVGWVHYLDPHQPYSMRAGFDFGSSREQQYYSEVAFVDAQIGKLLDGLRQAGAYRDSMIVFFADHGEALGERKYYGHHVFLNGWIADIPFMLHVPGSAAKVLRRAVSIVDVAPTVLHFLNQTPSSSLSGESLLSPDATSDRVIVSEAFPIRGKSLFDLANVPLTSIDELKARIELIQHEDQRYAPKVSLVRGRYRLIVRRTSGTAELFDLAHDPRERHDIAGERPDLVESMMGHLAAFQRAEATRFYCAVKALPPPKPALKKVPPVALQGPAKRIVPRLPKLPKLPKSKPKPKPSP